MANVTQSLHWRQAPTSVASPVQLTALAFYDKQAIVVPILFVKEDGKWKIVGF